MNIKKISTLFIIVLIIGGGFIGVLLFNNYIDSDNDIYFRYNQFGYNSNQKKYAVIMSQSKLETISLHLSDDSWSTDLSFIDRPGYNFAHIYLLNFTYITAVGEYYFETNDIESSSFDIAIQLDYLDLAEDSLNFLWVNQANNAVPGWHGAAHQQDAIIYDEDPLINGKYVNLTGGWYDAGDYLKFAKPTTETLIWLLLGKYLFENQITGEHGKTNLGEFSELVDNFIERGISYINTTAFSIPGRIVIMVGNASDHEQDIRLPENDLLNPRYAYLNEKGKGANIAAFISAAFSLYTLLGTKNYTREAIQMYEFAESNLDIQNNLDYYTEESYIDELAFANIMLFKITNNTNYLYKAQEYYETYWNDPADFLSTSIALGSYFIATEVDTPFDYVEQMYDTISWHLSNINADSFNYIWDEYFWGSAPRSLEVGFYALLLRNLDINPSNYALDNLAMSTWDNIFGINPWGYSFVSGYGDLYPTIHHNQLEVIHNKTIIGALSLGGDRRDELIDLGLPAPDSEFQTDKAVFYPTFESYVNNEPTIYTNAILYIFTLAMNDQGN